MTPKEQRSSLTPDRLRELLHYEPETGAFVSRQRRSGVPYGRALGYVTKRGYRMVRVDNELHMAHRLAWLYMTGQWPSDEIDHRNGARSDNRWCNLRAATAKQNRENRAREASNSSGFRGVSWCAARRRWLAQIKHQRRQINLGRFDDLFDAVGARLRAERDLFTHHRGA